MNQKNGGDLAHHDVGPGKAIMPKSELALFLDKLQGELSGLLRHTGFKKHGRTYNRTTADGLVQVIGFQMGAFDPPGTTYIPELRQNLYGRFCVNLGIYIPEVALHHGGGEARPVVHDYNCCIRTRLGQSLGKEPWWRLTDTPLLIDELRGELLDHALPFFRRFESRQRILDEFASVEDNTELIAVPRIVCAIIFLTSGEPERARALLAAQASGHTRNPRARFLKAES